MTRPSTDRPMLRRPRTRSGVPPWASRASWAAFAVLAALTGGVAPPCSAGPAKAAAVAAGPAAKTAQPGAKDAPADAAKDAGAKDEGAPSLEAAGQRAASDVVLGKSPDGKVDKGEPDGTRRLTLAELWTISEQRFPGLKASRETLQGAKYTRDEQKWLRLPSGELTTYLTWSPDLKCKSAGDAGTMYPQGIVGGAQQCLETNGALTLSDGDWRRFLPIYGVLFRLDARITQPLFTFGKLDVALKLGETGVKIAQAQSDATRSDLALNVMRAYFGLKTARAAMETVREGQQQIVRWVKQIDKDLEDGKSGYSEIDLMRLKVAESQVQLAVVDLDRTIKSTLAAVRYLAQASDVDVDETDLELFAGESQSLAYYIDAALANRPELKQLNAYGDGARLMRKLRIAELLPDFGLIANVGYGVATSVQDPNNAFMNRFNYVGAGLGLGMRLGLDFGPKAARLQKAIADVNVYDSKRREALGGGALEIERAYNDLLEAQQRLKAAETAERRARGWLQGVRQAIDVGTAESRDMIDALRTYFDQHLTVLRTINDVNVQAGVLRRLSGLEVIPR